MIAHLLSWVIPPPVRLVAMAGAFLWWDYIKAHSAVRRECERIRVIIIIRIEPPIKLVIARIKKIGCEVITPPL